MTRSLPDDLAARIRRLPPQQQQQALAYVQALEGGGAEGLALLQLVGTISPEDLSRMAAAIEADCERVDATGW